MKQIDCILIEDEPLAAAKLAGFIERVPYLRLCGQFTEPVSASAFIKSQPIDLIFLDIEMEGMSGITFLESAQIRSFVILTTAFEKYALKGYELRVVDYLLKPYSFDRFFKAVEQVWEKVKAAPAARDFFFVKTEHRSEKVMFDDLLYIEGMGDYRYLKTLKGNIMTLETFAELEDDLPPDKVCRVHKSYMVAVAKIDAVSRGRLTIGKDLIPVSDTYRDKIYRLLNIS